jgi:hypothetical protein
VVLNIEPTSHGILRKEDQGSYTFSAPSFDRGDSLQSSNGSEQAFSWITRDLGPIVLALLKNYRTKGHQIIGKTFHAVNERAPYERLAKVLGEGVYDHVICTRIEMVLMQLLHQPPEKASRLTTTRLESLKLTKR